MSEEMRELVIALLTIAYMSAFVAGIAAAFAGEPDRAMVALVLALTLIHIKWDAEPNE